MEEVGAFVWKEAIEHGADAFDEAVDGSRRLLSQERFELGERHLDGVHVGAVRRQVEDLGAALGDRFADAGDLVGGQVVEDDDIAWPEGRREDMLDVDAEGIAIHRAIEHPGRGHAGEAQPGNERHRFPVSERHLVAAALAHRRPAVEPRHLGVHPGLVEEDEALRIEERLRCSPQPAPGRDVGPVLLGRAQGFF